MTQHKLVEWVSPDGFLGEKIFEVTPWQQDSTTKAQDSRTRQPVLTWTKNQIENVSDSHLNDVIQ